MIWLLLSVNLVAEEIMQAMTSMHLPQSALYCYVERSFSQTKQIKLDKELGWPALIHQNNYLIDIRTNFISQCVLIFCF